MHLNPKSSRYLYLPDVPELLLFTPFVTVHSVHSNVAQILYPELTFLSLYRIIKYYSFKNIFKKGVIIHAG